MVVSRQFSCKKALISRTIQKIRSEIVFCIQLQLTDAL